MQEMPITTANSHEQGSTKPMDIVKPTDIVNQKDMPTDIPADMDPIDYISLLMEQEHR